LLISGRIRQSGQTDSSNRGLQWFNSDGSWDTNLVTPVAAVWSAYLQTNGQYLVGGDFTVPWPDGRTRSRILRLNPDGGIDFSFDPGTGPNGGVGFVWGQPDGKVVINGNFSIVRDYARNRLARFNPDGTLDDSFQQSGWIA